MRDPVLATEPYAAFMIAADNGDRIIRQTVCRLKVDKSFSIEAKSATLRATPDNPLAIAINTPDVIRWQPVRCDEVGQPTPVVVKQTIGTHSQPDSSLGVWGQITHPRVWQPSSLVQ